MNFSILLLSVVLLGCGSKDANSENANAAPNNALSGACEVRFLEASLNPDGTRHRYYEFCCPANVNVTMKHLWDTNAVPEAVNCKQLQSDDQPACKTAGLKRFLCEPIANCSAKAK